MGIEHDFRSAAGGVIEIVTDDGAITALEHNLTETNAEVRIKQRWLLPTRRIWLGGTAEAIGMVRSQDGESVLAVRVNERTLAVLNGELEEWADAELPRRSGSALSVTLKSREVAAISGETLVIAVPWGPV